MRLGAFQFPATNSITNNCAAIERGIALAAKQQVELLLTQECSLTGYPPIEVASVDDIDYVEVQAAIHRIQDLVGQCGVSVVLGAVIRDENGTFNESVALFPNNKEPVHYGKRALWGWDSQNFLPGTQEGIFELGGFRFGMRVCFEIRFPEFFRELFDSNVDVALVAFNDTSRTENKIRRALIRAHLQTRAVENAIVVVSSNGLKDFQTCPTCIVSPDGHILAEAKEDHEELIFYDLEREESNFGRKGREEISRRIRNLTG